MSYKVEGGPSCPLASRNSLSITRNTHSCQLCSIPRTIYRMAHAHPRCRLRPRTITADFAAFVPQVVGLEPVVSPLEVARATVEGRGLKNAEFVVGDVHQLDFDDKLFDVVHCYHVLCHVGDPVQALRVMKRVTKDGRYVAAWECNVSIMTWFPEEVGGLQGSQRLWMNIARGNGGEPEPGRRLVHWAREAGFERDKIKATTTAWCF
jgi:SAM-dependent methyltransferase